MSDKEKDTVGQNDNAQTDTEKKKKRFTVQSPYADYAADNDKVSELMEESEGEEPIKPTAKDLLQTVLAAAGLVGIFIGIALMFSIVGTCMGK